MLDELKRFLDTSLGRISSKSSLAQAIRYATSRWDALSRFITDGRLEMSNNAAERAIRPLAMRRSLCFPSSSVCKHWRLAFVSDATRTACSSDRGGHSFVVQVGGPDLVGSAWYDLLGGKDTALDEPAYAMVRDPERSSGFRHREPLAVFLGGAEH